MTARAATDLTAPANLRWNFTVNLIDIAFITLGISLVSRDTVLPVLISTLTDSNLAIGLIAALYGMGIYLPQLFTANFTERLRYKKPFVMLVGSVGERLPYLLMGIAVWLFAVRAPSVALILVLGCLALTGFSAGAATPAWYDLIAKVIPVQRRGMWSGVSHGIGALMAIFGALLVGRILDGLAYPNNFALLFGLAFLATCISFVGLALNREPPSEIVKARVSTRHYFRQLPDLLRANANYRRFFISRTVILMGAMANGFLIIYGRERFVLDGATIGLLTAVLVASQAVMSLVWGVIGDRAGHKIVLTCAAFVLALAALTTLLAPSPGWLILSFVLLGAASSGDAVSGLNIILEFAAPADRPTYIGLTNTLLAPTIIVAPILGGWLATVAGFPTLLVIATAFAATGGMLLALWVQEPRRQPLPIKT
ncbi:MAG: MFS transporter [Caldilineaceae bacterium]|nr:MFS transporter [Caldilineaceae bacterium]